MKKLFFIVLIALFSCVSQLTFASQVDLLTALRIECENIQREPNKDKAILLKKILKKNIDVLQQNAVIRLSKTYQRLENVKNQNEQCEDDYCYQQQASKIKRLEKRIRELNELIAALAQIQLLIEI